MHAFMISMWPTDVGEIHYNLALEHSHQRNIKVKEFVAENEKINYRKVSTKGQKWESRKHVRWVKNDGEQC